MTPLPAGLEASYRATELHYYDAHDVHYVARPAEAADDENPPWDLPGTFYVVTACNPGSAKRGAAENRAANADLAARLRVLGAWLAPVDARSSDGQWREPSFAVWNVSEEALARLMRELGQAAFFCVEDGRRRLAPGTHAPADDRVEGLAVTRTFDVDDAVRLAAHAHRGQVDKAGEPYVLHPIRVALRLRERRHVVAALLHDVVEDTGRSLDELRRRGVDPEVVEAIDALTKREGEDYLAEFIERVHANPIATAVKLADVDDNMDPARLCRLPEAKQAELRKKYEAVRRRLSG